MPLPSWPRHTTVVITANNAVRLGIPEGHQQIPTNVRARYLLSTNEVIVSDTNSDPGADEGRSGTAFKPLQGERRIDFGVLVAIVATAALVIFILQNTRSTTITWFVFDRRAPLWVVIVVTALVSVALSHLVLFVWQRGRRRRRRD